MYKNCTYLSIYLSIYLRKVGMHIKFHMCFSRKQKLHSTIYVFRLFPYTYSFFLIVFLNQYIYIYIYMGRTPWLTQESSSDKGFIAGTAVVFVRRIWIQYYMLMHISLSLYCPFICMYCHVISHWEEGDKITTTRIWIDSIKPSKKVTVKEGMWVTQGRAGVGT